MAQYGPIGGGCGAGTGAGTRLGVPVRRNSIGWGRRRRRHDRSSRPAARRAPGRAGDAVRCRRLAGHLHPPLRGGVDHRVPEVDGDRRLRRRHRGLLPAPPRHRRALRRHHVDRRSLRPVLHGPRRHRPPRQRRRTRRWRAGVRRAVGPGQVDDDGPRRDRRRPGVLRRPGADPPRHAEHRPAGRDGIPPARLGLATRRTGGGNGGGRGSPPTAAPRCRSRSRRSTPHRCAPSCCPDQRATSRR